MNRSKAHWTLFVHPSHTTEKSAVMTKAKIYQPAKTAMQSGKSKDSWLLEFVSEKPFFTDNLMGWTGMSDMTQEIHLFFPTREAAEAYAKRSKIPYEVILPRRRSHLRKSYADNFKFNRISG